jgi:hypothetical protein
VTKKLVCDTVAVRDGGGLACADKGVGGSLARECPRAAPQGGSVGRRMRDEARALALHGYGVWARADLAPWPEIHSALLLAAGGLCAERAPEFGFIALADAASV